MEVGAGTVQLSRNSLAVCLLRPMGAWDERDAKTTRLKVDALMRTTFFKLHH